MVGQVGNRRHRRAKDFPVLVQHVLILIPMKGHSKICVMAFLSSLDPPLRPAFCTAPLGIICSCAGNPIGVKPKFVLFRCWMRIFLSKVLGVKVENGFR